MNPYIAAAVAEMDKVPVSRLEHPGDTALDPASCRFVAAFARALEAQRVLEFGSGFSTLMLARELAAQEENYLLSIDDSRHYSELAREAMDNSGCQAKVEFRVAPLKPRFYGPRLLLSHDLPPGLLEAKGPFDLVLIDTPHHNFGREAVFYDAFRALSPGGYVIMADANREAEENLYVRSWMSAYEDAIDPVLLEGIGSGISVIEKVSEAEPRYTAKGLLPASLKTLFGYGRMLLRRDNA
jgi:predicted O-methyltransferase YrrM